MRSFTVPALAVLFSLPVSAAVITVGGEIDNTHSTLFGRYVGSSYDDTAGSEVWTDVSSGASNDLTNKNSDTTTRPSKVTSGGPNGQAYADFDGNDRIWSNAVDLTGGQYTVVMAARVDTVTNGYFFDGTTSSQRGDLFGGSTGAPNRYTMYAGSNTISAPAGDTIDTGEWQIHTLVFNTSGTSSHSVNGEESYSGSLSVGTWQTLILGGRYNQVSLLDGGIADFLIYNTVLSESEISDVEGALSTQYDITLVPEPSAAALLGLGGLAFFLRRRK